VMVEERSLSGRMLGPWRAEIGMVEVELSKMIGALDGNENIMIEANYFVLVHPAEGIGHSIGWRPLQVRTRSPTYSDASDMTSFLICQLFFAFCIYEKFLPRPILPPASMGVLLDRAIMRWSSHLFLHCINKCYQVRHRFPLFWPAMDQRMLQIVQHIMTDIEI